MQAGGGTRCGTDSINIGCKSIEPIRECIVVTMKVQCKSHDLYYLAKDRLSTFSVQHAAMLQWTTDSEHNLNWTQLDIFCIMHTGTKNILKFSLIRKYNVSILRWPDSQKKMTDSFGKICFVINRKSSTWKIVHGCGEIQWQTWLYQTQSCVNCDDDFYSSISAAVTGECLDTW